MFERKLAELEKKYDDQFKIVFEAIAELMTPVEEAQKKIVFELKERRAKYGKKDGRKVSNGDVLRCPQGLTKRPVLPLMYGSYMTMLANLRSCLKTEDKNDRQKSGNTGCRLEKGPHCTP
jgi:hypothetical protein